MILFISNGHGEDLIGAIVAHELLELMRQADSKAASDAAGVCALPLVGLGRPYRDAGIRVLGETRVLPSGGFAKHGVSLFLRDLAAGLPGLTLAQIRTMQGVRNQVRLAVCVGDIYPVLMARLFLGSPILFLSTAKSEYIRGHLGIEKLVMRRTCELVLARDEATAMALRRSGVRARFVGNVMMDSFSITGENFGLSLERKVVGIMPGSREEAYDNMAAILNAVVRLDYLSGGALDFLAALAPSLDVERLGRRVDACGWEFVSAPVPAESGVVGELRCRRPGRSGSVSGSVCGSGFGSGHGPGRDGDEAGAGAGAGDRDRGGDRAAREIRVVVTQGRFGDVLNIASIFIGLAGTANEQACGMGKPVVAFVGRGPQFNRRFALAQKRLLGDALSIVESDPDIVAREVLAILNDTSRYNAARKTGAERMGGPGGARRVAGLIRNYLENGTWGE
ncbi:MAG TPA: hypothetical protein GXX51_07625 [Firmicutes bacterium]|nr:hypothetical protein [Bacillota bacterium]